MSDNKSPTPVVAIVLNWNGHAVLDACVSSLRAQTYRALRILVVDNGSTDGSATDIKVRYPDIDVLLLDRNRGFGAGNNEGIRASTEPYILIVNNDTILDRQCVEQLAAKADENETIGSVATKIVLFDTPDRIDAAGMTICPDGMAIGRGRMEPVCKYDQPSEIFFASDCCCLFRRKMIDTIGLYDEDFFAYDEITDLGWRARRAGWKSFYVPTARVIHHHSASSGSHSPFKAFLVERNRVWVAVKNFPAGLILFGILFTTQRFFWQAYGALAGKGRAGAFTKDHSIPALAATLLKAYTEALTGLPRMLRKRRATAASGSLTTHECLRLLKSFGISAHDIALKD